MILHSQKINMLFINLKVGHSIKASGIIILEMGLANKFGLMVQNM